MLKVIARIEVVPECLEVVLPIQKEAVEVTRKEPGCLEYGLYQNIETPNVLTFVSLWATDEDFEIHAKTPYLAEKGQRLTGMIRSKDIQFYTPL